MKIQGSKGQYHTPKKTKKTLASDPKKKKKMNILIVPVHYVWIQYWSRVRHTVYRTSIIKNSE